MNWRSLRRLRRRPQIVALKILLGVVAAVFYAEITPPANAGPIILNASDSGNYLVDSGLFGVFSSHDSTSKNYSAGSVASPVDVKLRRNYFVFDLASVTEDIVSARLVLADPSHGGTPTKGVYTIYDVVTPIDVLEASQTGSVASGVWNDLGTGTVYGSVTVGPADVGTLVVINLNDDALAALNAARGGQFAIGGDYQGDNLVFPSNTIFNDTGAGDTRQLVINPIVPEPSSLSLLGLGALALVAYARRRNRQRKP